MSPRWDLCTDYNASQGQIVLMGFSAMLTRDNVIRLVLVEGEGLRQAAILASGGCTFYNQLPQTGWYVRGH